MDLAAPDEIPNGLGVVEVLNQEVLTTTQPPPARERLMIPMSSMQASVLLAQPFGCWLHQVPYDDFYDWTCIARGLGGCPRHSEN